MLDLREDHFARLEETKRLGRVLRMVELVAAQPRAWSRKRLAERFEISVRMIDKDLELIRNALCFDLRRVRNGYYFVGGPLLKPVELTIPEALGLALAAQQARDTGTVDASVIGSVLARLEEALPRGIIPYLRRDSATTARPFGPTRERTSTLATLEQAMAEGRRAAIDYATASRDGSRSSRTIAPYYLQPYGRSWIIIAHDSARDAVRMFKIDRIESCRLTSERYTIPADFDPVTYLGAGWGMLRGESGPPEDIVVRFTPRAARWARDERWHPSQSTENQPDGSVIMRFHCGITPELVRWILGYGSDICVEIPDHLREQVIAEAKLIATRYSE